MDYIEKSLNSRVRQINSKCFSKGNVLYWMSRDQRCKDNWALVFAQRMARENKCKLMVAFCIAPEFLNAGQRLYLFMVQGLKKVEKELCNKNIPFHITSGQPEKCIPEIINRFNIGLLISDFDPLKTNLEWKRKVNTDINIPFYEVDSHNIIPCWKASSKQEYSAYTFRRKIEKLLPDYLTDMIPLSVQQTKWKNIPKNDWNKIETVYRKSIEQSLSLKTGTEHAERLLTDFINTKLPGYSTDRNNPVLSATSNLSPYLHFGQIASQRVALEIRKAIPKLDIKGGILDELIVRKELSDNYCYYNKYYDTFYGFPDWAKLTLNIHRSDTRHYIYSIEDFERCQTHDPLWNAAQMESLITGKMHGYLRMYWAKKILEWTDSPESALQIAIYLNDKYSIDGRDPNGYTGIAWSIGGVHDRAWKERNVFGKIRYMSFNGMKSKFNINKYIEKINKINI